MRWKEQTSRGRGFILRDVLYEQGERSVFNLPTLMSDGGASREGGGKGTGCSTLGTEKVAERTEERTPIILDAFSHSDMMRIIPPSAHLPTSYRDGSFCDRTNVTTRSPTPRQPSQPTSRPRRAV